MSACYGWHVGKSGPYSAALPESVAAMYVVVLHLIEVQMWFLHDEWVW